MRKILIRIATAVATFTLLSAAQARDMSFHLVEPRKCRSDCDRLLVASGRITADSHREFLAVARSLPRGVRVRLNSPGGTLVGGMLLGLALRRRGAVVTVARGATCASACAYAFLGGVHRRVSPGAKLGVHRFYTSSSRFRALSRSKRQAIARQAANALRVYIAAMGARPELAAFAARTAPSEIHYMNRRELRRYRVVTARRAAREGARNGRSARRMEKGAPARFHARRKRKGRVSGR